MAWQNLLVNIALQLTDPFDSVASLTILARDTNSTSVKWIVTLMEGLAVKTECRDDV